MINEKRKSDMAAWVAYILIALMFGAFLGSPLPDIWAGRISEAVSSLKAQTIKPAFLHNGTAEEQFEIGGPAKSAAGNTFAKTAAFEAVMGATANKPVKAEAGSPDKLINTEGSGQLTEAGSPDKLSEAGSPGKLAEAGSPATSTAAGISMIVSDPPASEAAARLAASQPDYLVINVNRSGVASRKEMDVLIRLINAEAYGLSYKAKIAVGQVVMNRWKGPHYGDDLLAIMTAPYQFTPIHNGSAYKKKIEPSSIEAANAVLAGTGVKELTDDTYYFVNPDFTEDKTIENNMEFVCEIEGLHFFKPPSK